MPPNRPMLRAETRYTQRIRALFFSLLLLFPIADLLMATAYQITNWEGVVALRYYRDVISFCLGIFGLLSPQLPPRIRITAFAYFVFIGVYTLTSVIQDRTPIAVIAASIGAIVLPITLTLSAFVAIRTPQDVSRVLRILSIYGVVSVLFGLWEIDHTEFWTDTVNLGRYILNVKDTITGFQADVFLPWNFSGLGGARRAAGILAAPLAQGFFLAVVGVVGFAYWRGRSHLMAALLLGICFYGAHMSGTRGGLLTATIAIAVYLLWPTRQIRTRQRNLLMLVIVGMLAMPTITHYVLYTVRLEDDSTEGHLMALEKNIADIGDVLLIGDGIGRAGAFTSSNGLTTSGGGEGALFSIAYQIGVPGACLFLLYYALLFQWIYAQRQQEGTRGELARAIACLFIGVFLSMFASDHVLSFSGMAAFWFLVGGYAGYAERHRATPLRAPGWRTHTLPTLIGKAPSHAT